MQKFPLFAPAMLNGWRMQALEDCIEVLLASPTTSTTRLLPLADLVKELFRASGLHNVRGGSGGELCVPGLARVKDWDVAYEFAGKFRLLVSLKSLLKNLSGSIPNRLDDLQGELANIQQLWPEIVIGYVVLVDVASDSVRRQDQRSWLQFFEDALRRISIRRPPLWNQGLLEALWYIRFDSRLPRGQRLVDPDAVAAEGQRFIATLIAELAKREPAVPIGSIT